MNCFNYMSFSSFLAGALLVKKDIPYLEFSAMSADFEQKANVEFLKDDNYIDEIYNLFYLGDDGFHLKFDYDTIIDNIGYKVNVYLYSLTNDLVRNYFKGSFNISKEDMQFVEINLDNISKKRRS